MRDDLRPGDEDRWVDAIRRLPPVPPPSAVRARLMAEAERQAVPRQRFRRATWWWWGAPLAAAALLVVWLRPSTPDELPPAFAVAAGDAAHSLVLLSLQSPGSAALTAARDRLGPGSSAPVRVLAVDALARVAEPEALESILVETARSDPSPFVQASVLSASLSLSPESSARVARALLERDDIDAVLRTEAGLLDISSPR